MRRLLGLSVVVVTAWVLTLGNTQGQDKAETLLITKKAGEIAKDFADDSGKAKKTYSPDPPKGGAGGAIISTSGVLEKVVGADLYLKVDPPTKPPIKVVIRLKKADAAAKGNKLVEVDGGKFKEFKNNTIVIEADGVKLTQIIGKEDK